MRIANPLYDTAFKYLMENNKLAKKIISLIIEEDIDELQIENQEHVYTDEKRMLRMYRVDFKAIIRHPDGSRQKVLIELQKSKSPAEVQRFRRYLGINYIKTDTEPVAGGEDRKVSYPIITIYILGYPLDEVPYTAITINNCVINSVSKEKLDLSSMFVKLLTHRSHILQVARLPEERRSRLEQFLSLFSQKYKTSDGYILDLHDIPEEFVDIAQYLALPLQDEKFLLDVLAEEELEQTFAEKDRKLEDTLQELSAIKMLAEKERAEKESALAEKEKNRSALAQTAKMLLSMGVSKVDIAKNIGLTPDELEELLS